MTAGPNVLIASGTYVSAEIAAEFGRIPPALLPIGNRRLYRWQVEAIRAALPDAPLFMSLPLDFDLDHDDARALDALGVEIVRAPKDLGLGAALTYVILSANLISAPLCLLHGDTLLQGYPFAAPDSVSAGLTRTYYPWADYLEVDGRLEFPDSPPEAVDRQVLTGAFHLADTPLFLRCLAQSEGDFVASLSQYSQTLPLQTVRSGEWFDFGHLHTYFQSRRRVTTERHFNRLESEGQFFIKSSSNVVKIDAERAWFQGLPDDLKVFTPQVAEAAADGDGAAYRIEYCHLTTLSDLYVFGRLPVSVWRSIFDACSAFLTAANRHRRPASDPGDAQALYLTKTMERIEQFGQDHGIHLESAWTFNGQPTPPLRRIVEELAREIGATPTDLDSIIHGDFCFSNILFDFRTQRIKLIDPRGLDAHGRPSLYGDGRYETGKLHHSAIGLYDHIVAGQFEVRRLGARDLELSLPVTRELQATQALFAQTPFGGRSLQETRAAMISVLLFLSMLPLHSDNPERQWALLANALRLYCGLDHGGRW